MTKNVCIMGYKIPEDIDECCETCGADSAGPCGKWVQAADSFVKESANYRKNHSSDIAQDAWLTALNAMIMPMRVALEAAEQSAWSSDMDAAPREKTQFQGWVVDDTGHSWWEPRCRYDEHEVLQMWGRQDYDEGGWGTYPSITITHWRHLPEGPKDE